MIVLDNRTINLFMCLFCELYYNQNLIYIKSFHSPAIINMAATLPTHYISLNFNDFNAEKYFSQYHHFEKFDQSQHYTKQMFKNDYGNGYLIYKYSVHILEDRHGFEMYVVAEEDLSKEDREQLIPYCKCTYHKMHWLNPLKLFFSRCYSGCLESTFTKQNVINDTREYLKKLNDENITFSISNPIFSDILNFGC